MVTNKQLKNTGTHMVVGMGPQPKCDEGSMPTTAYPNSVVGRGPQPTQVEGRMHTTVDVVKHQANQPDAIRLASCAQLIGV